MSVSLKSALVAVGKYAIQASSKKGCDEPLFDYPEKIDKRLNAKLSSIFRSQNRNFSEMQAKGKTSKPLYIQNIPFTPSNNQNKAFEKWDNLTTIIRDESFGTDAEASKKQIGDRLMAVIGMNRPTSIDPEDDRNFKALPQILLKKELGFQCRIISTLWKTQFAMRGIKKTVPYDIAQISFIVLQYLETTEKPLAKKCKKHLTSLSLRDQVPFVHIREWIKDETCELLKQPVLASRLTQQPVYLMVMDDDPKGFRAKDSKSSGLFTVYDEIVKARGEQPPQLMSTGYFAAPDEGLLADIAIDLDMRVRAAIAKKKFPRIIYFPEPNTGVLISDASILKKLSFLPTSSSHGLDAENRRLIAHIWSELEPDRIVFEARRCLLTTLADRMKPSQPLFSPKANFLGQLEVLKALKGISQTHIDVSILSNATWMALDQPKPKGMYSLKPILSELLQCFDPISIAQSLPRGTQNYSFNSFKFMMEVYSDFVKELYESFNEDVESNEWAELAAKEANSIWPKASKDISVDAYTAAGNAYTKKLKVAYQEAVEAVGKEQAKIVLKVARVTGKTTYEVLRDVQE